MIFRGHGVLCLSLLEAVACTIFRNEGGVNDFRTALPSMSSIACVGFYTPLISSDSAAPMARLLTLGFQFGKGLALARGTPSPHTIARHGDRASIEHGCKVKLADDTQATGLIGDS